MERKEAREIKIEKDQLHKVTFVKEPKVSHRPSRHFTLNKLDDNRLQFVLDNVKQLPLSPKGWYVFDILPTQETVGSEYVDEFWRLFLSMEHRVLYGPEWRPRYQMDRQQAWHEIPPWYTMIESSMKQEEHLTIYLGLFRPSELVHPGGKGRFCGWGGPSECVGRLDQAMKNFQEPLLWIPVVDVVLKNRL